MDPGLTTLNRLDQWKSAGVITEAQHAVLGALVRKERVSVFLELSALMYLGVLFFVGGLGWTFKAYVVNLGDAAILSILGLLFASALYYCLSRATPYSNDEVESPSLVFDYVVYLACLLLGVTWGFLELRFELFKNWNVHLLIASGAFAALAYRFDNRFVLSLALSTLAGWLGLKISSFDAISTEPLRVSALLYGAFVSGLGLWLHRQGIKPHFFEVFLHIAANVVLVATMTGVSDSEFGPAYLVALVALSAAAIALGVRYKRFAFVAYGTFYVYVGITLELMDILPGLNAFLLYLVVSGTLVIASLVVLARRFGRDE